MGKNIYIFYHGDHDGECSAYWASTKYIDPNNKLNFIRCDYNKKKADLSQVKKDDIVWIVDYSIEPSDMKKLLNKTKDLTWIDHHATAIEKYKNYPHKIKGIRQKGIAACMLTWCYINNEKSTKNAPRFLKLLSDWDIFGKKYSETNDFHYGLLTRNTLPASHIWRSLNFFPTFVERTIKEGKIIQRFYKNLKQEEIDDAGFNTEIDGYKCFCLNARGSGYLCKLIPEKYDILVCFIFNGKDYDVSLYSDKPNVDASKIAIKFGGGGHKGACGFNIKDLSFLNI